MPGTLMYECCLHTLRVFLMRMGWVGEADEVACEPVPGVASRLKCRGQVIATTKKVTYEVTVKELGYRPEPYAIADALMYADGKPIVEITDMSLRLSGLTRERLDEIWTSVERDATGLEHDRRLTLVGRGSYDSASRSSRSRPATRRRRSATATGRSTATAFIARLPGPPYSVPRPRHRGRAASRGSSTAGGHGRGRVRRAARRLVLRRQPLRRHAVQRALEIALQPCGWLAAYLGSALTSPDDLYFRNLGGKATQLAAGRRRTPARSTTT